MPLALMQRQFKAFKIGSEATDAELSNVSEPMPQRPEIQHKRSSSLARIQRRLRTIRTRSSESDVIEVESDEEIRGALGLTLLSEPSEPHADFVFVSGLCSI